MPGCATLGTLTTLTSTTSWAASEALLALGRQRGTLSNSHAHF